MPDTSSDDPLQLTIERFWEAFPPVWNRIRGHLRLIVAQTPELSVEQFHILRHIRAGVNSVSELARIKQISRPAISQCVDELVQKGLVSRRTSTADRRFIDLEVTPQGSELIAAIYEKNRAWMAQKMASLTPEELIEITRTLDLLHNTFDEPEN